MTTEINSKFRR